VVYSAAWENKENNWSKKALEGSAQLQAGAGIDIGPENGILRSDRDRLRGLLRLPALFYLAAGMFGVENLVQVAGFCFF
jgi:hypothetical protein